MFNFKTFDSLQRKYLTENAVWIHLSQQKRSWRFIKQIQEFKQKTGVDEIRFTEDKKKGKEDFLNCGAFGKTECVVAALDLMKNEAGCRNSFVGTIVLFNWNDRNVNIVIFQ